MSRTHNDPGMLGNTPGRHSRNQSSSSISSQGRDTLGYPPNLVQGYTLLSELGRGSFAVVFLARSAGKRGSTTSREQSGSSFRSLSGLLKFSSSASSTGTTSTVDTAEVGSRDFVAIKIVSKEKLNKKLTENLESEIAILKRIRHENVVNLLKIDETPQYMCLVMEYCSWHDLAMYIKRRGLIDPVFEGSHVNAPSIVARAQAEMAATNGNSKPSSSALNSRVHHALLGAVGLVENPLAGPLGGLAEFVVRYFTKQIASALAFLRAHHMIHRDLKPQNILLLPSKAWHELPALGTENYRTAVAQHLCRNLPRMKIADFGFARVLPQQSLASTLCGSPLYMAPEILRYEKYDAKADLWSLGAVIYECVTGKVPYRAQNHVELLQKIERRPPKFPDDAVRLQMATAGGKERGRSLAHSGQTPSSGLVPSLWQLSPPNIATSIGSPSSVASSPFFSSSASKGYVTISDDLRGLIKGLLRKNPIERLGFDEVFMHPCVGVDPLSVHESPQTEANGTPIPGSGNRKPSTASSASSVASSSGSVPQRMLKGAVDDDGAVGRATHSRNTSVSGVEEDQGDDHPLVPGINGLQFDDVMDAGGGLLVPFPEYKTDLDAFMLVISASEPAAASKGVPRTASESKPRSEDDDGDFVMISSQKGAELEDLAEDAGWPAPGTDVIQEINGLVSQGWSMQQFLQKLPSLLGSKSVLRGLGDEEQQLRILVLRLVLQIYRKALRRLDIVSNKGNESSGAAIVDANRLSQLSMWLQHNADKCASQLDGLLRSGAADTAGQQPIFENLLSFSKVAATQELAIHQKVNSLKPHRDGDALAACIKELKYLQQLYKMLALVLESLNASQRSVSNEQSDQFLSALQTRAGDIDKRVEQLCTILGVNPL